MASNEQALNSCAQDGRRGFQDERSALQAAVLPHLPLLRALARVRTGDTEAADELVHDTLVRAASQGAVIPDPANGRAWLLTAQREIHARREEGRCDRNGPSASRMWARRPGLQAALLQLSDPVREALFLSDGVGLSDKELADALDCSLEAARHRVSRGRSALMGRLGKWKISTANCSA